MIDNFKLLIGGELVDGDSSMEVIDPVTGDPIQTVPRSSARQLHQAVAAAKGGTVWINHYADLRPNVPFGGAK